MAANVMAAIPDGRLTADRFAKVMAALEAAPVAPEIREVTFAPDDIEALRAYVAEEVRLHGGLSDAVLMYLHEQDRSDSAHEAAMDILDAVPRLSDGPLI